MLERINLVATAVEKALDGSLPWLWNVVEEVSAVAVIATQAKVSCSTASSQTSKNQVFQSFVSADMVPLACHGIQDSSKPHQSRFALGDGSLTVAELMELDLKNPFFAFLSVCEIAKGNQKHADKVVHLAATMLFGGEQH